MSPPEHHRFTATLPGRHDTIPFDVPGPRLPADPATAIEGAWAWLRKGNAVLGRIPDRRGEPFILNPDQILTIHPRRDI